MIPQYHIQEGDGQFFFLAKLKKILFIFIFEKKNIPVHHFLMIHLDINYPTQFKDECL